MRLAILNRVEIALHGALVAKQSKFLQLCLPDTAANLGEILQRGFAGKLLVERDEFTKFAEERAESQQEGESAMALAFRRAMEKKK